MRADDFLNEGGLRSWLWKLGKDAVDYAAGQAPRVKNTIDQPKGGVFGGRVPGSSDDVSHVYRNMSPEELAAAHKSGYFEKNPAPGRTTWDTDKKYWSQGDTEGYFGRAWKDTPDNAQVRLPQEKLPRWTAGRTGDAEVLDKFTGTWGPVKEDDLDEMAGKINVGISQYLAKKGYKYLGGGIDKQAYLEPGGQVYIVFGYRQGTIFDFSPDQRMFVNWINYCNKNSNNPHLPRFSGFESFEFQGRRYIQARMEALRELPGEVGNLVGNIEEAVRKLRKNNYDTAFNTLINYAQHSSYEDEDPYYYEIENTMELLGGAEAAKNLLKTVKTVQQFARKHNYSIDLHRGNYMQRPDGTIVVNDPFVIWERNL
jgi:hypothetical protein